jgi:hypothetical protein
MAKGTGLVILAIFIALGGLGIGIYTMITPGVHRTYYDERTTSYTSGAEDTWYDIPELSISFQVDLGESVYFLFTCQADLVATSGVVQMHFGLKIDGSSVTQSQVTVGHNEGSTINTMKFSVTIQYRATTMTAGAHTVVVETERECGGSISNCILLVQTYT